MHLNRTVCYERTGEEKAFGKVRSVYISARDKASITCIKTRDDYAFTKPDIEVRV